MLIYLVFMRRSSKKKLFIYEDEYNLTSLICLTSLKITFR